jgi:hypothetical protein
LGSIATSVQGWKISFEVLLQHSFHNHVVYVFSRDVEISRASLPKTRGKGEKAERRLSNKKKGGGAGIQSSNNFVEQSQSRKDHRGFCVYAIEIKVISL